ncbi:MAG: ABC transporter permease subunit [Spiroplasma sp.]
MTVNLKKVSFLIIAFVLLLVMLLIISLILLAAQINPLTFLAVIFLEPWKNLTYFSGFISLFAILLVAGLAVAITFKYKVYNFGVPGQMMISAIVTYVVAFAIYKAGWTNRAIVLFLLVLTIIVGAGVGLIVAILKNYFKINVIISTILINFIAWEGYKGLITSPNYQNQIVPEILSLRFSLTSGPLSPSNLFSAGIIIAFLILVITISLFNNRMLGFKLNVVAKNPIAAKQARIVPNHQILKVLPISGAIAGIAGYLYFLSTNSTLPKLDNIPQEGFYAIAIAGLTFYEPGVIFLSNFIFVLFIRPIHFNSFVYLKNPALAVIMLGVAIYLMGFFPFVWYLWDQSPFIQEKWFKIKNKLFKIATPIEEEIPGLEKSSRKQEVKTLNIILVGQKTQHKKWRLRKQQKKENERKG